jgi:iron complex outermembrane receptor protein
MKRLGILLTFMITTLLSVGQTDTATINLETVEVTGVRVTQKTPVTSKTVTAKQIKENYQGQEMSILLDKTPSVTSSTDGGHSQGYTYFRLRGIDQTRINMTLNGVPLNESEDQGVYFSNYPGFANNISSMQIQRGVGTSSNGVSSYSGSIDFKSPTGLKKGFGVEVGYGSFNTQRFNASHSTGLTDKKLALYTNFSTLTTSGYRNNSGGNGYSFFTSGGYYGKKDIIKVTAFSGNTINEMAWLPTSETDIAIDPKTNYNSPIAKDNFTQSFVQLQYNRLINNRSTLSTTVYYNRLDGVWDLDLTTFGAGPDILNFQLASNLYGVMSTYKYNTKKFDLVVGVNGNKYERAHSMAVLPDFNTTFYNNKGLKDEFSTFIKANYDIGKFSLFGDAQLRLVRFNYVGDVDLDQQNWTFFNPKGGVTYTVSKQLRHYISVGKSHREPTRTDMFQGEDNLITFTSITPEEVVDYELGTNYKKGKLQLSGNLYFMDFSNEITLIGALGSNGLPLMTNVDNSFRSGVELDYVYKFNNYLNYGGNANYSYNRITDGDKTYQPLFTPNLIVNQRLSVKVKGFGVGVSAKYHSESFIDQENTAVTPQFVVINVNGGYEFDNYSLLVSVNNVTSEKYYTNGYLVGSERHFFVNAPINAYVTFKMKF